MIGNLIKASMKLAFIPVGVVADLLSLPSTAYDAKPPFGNTTALTNNAVIALKKLAD